MTTVGRSGRFWTKSCTTKPCRHASTRRAHRPCRCTPVRRHTTDLGVFNGLCCFIDARASINNVGINHASSKHGSSQHNDDRDKSWSQGGVQPLDRLTLSFTLQAEQKSGRIQGLPSVKDLASACYSRQIRMAQHGSMHDLLSEFLLRVKYTLLRTKWLHFAQRSHRRRRANTTGVPSTIRSCLLPIGMAPHLCWR
jgi:hypothetical protein